MTHSFLNKTIFRTSTILVTVVAMLTFCIGFVAGARSTSTFAQDGKLQTKILGDVKTLLDTNFISWKASSTPPTDKTLEYGIISGYVNAYSDPYTTFFPPKEAKGFSEQVAGSFGGVGMQVGKKDNLIVVIAPLKDSPAMKAGIRAGDYVLAINGTSTENMSTDDAVFIIRGAIGTTVDLKILHKDEKVPVTITVTRDKIEVPTLDEKTQNNVFIISLYNFSAESAALFKKAITDFSNSGTPYLILDLRGNPGGYLESAVDIASYFLPQGTLVVSEKGGITEDDNNYRSQGYTTVGKNIRMVVLVDGGSASASEILAGALKDTGRATIVGEKTFGKGSVQKLFTLSDGSALKVTIAKWFTPKGTNISETGITPDVEAKLDYANYVKDKTDSQLLKAIEVVKNLQ